MIVRLGERLAKIYYDSQSKRLYAAIPDNAREGNEFRAVLPDVSARKEPRDAN